MHKKGFTLIEMLVVIIIMGILSITAFMYYGRFLERMRIAEADNLMGSSVQSQFRYRVRFSRFTPVWHKLDAVPPVIRFPTADNDYTNGETNTIFYTRGGSTKAEPNPGFAIEFEQDGANDWYIVATRVGRGNYTYKLVRAFENNRIICVPNESNEKDVEVCIDYMGVERPDQLTPDPRQP